MRRAPVSLQVTQTECGLSAAKSMLAYHHRVVPMADLRAALEPGRDGLNLGQLSHLLSQQGMQPTMYRVKDLRGLDSVATPFIAHWEQAHFVIVDRWSAEGATIMDPARGRIRITRAQFEQDFSGRILTATPGPSFRTARSRPFSTWRDKPLWPKDSVWSYARLILFSLAVFAMTLGVPVITQRLVDHTARGDLHLSQSLLVITLAAVVLVIFQVARTYAATTLVRAVSWQLLTSAFERLTRLPMKYFMTRPQGELIYRLNSLNHVRDILASKLVQGILDCLTALVLLGYVTWVSRPLGLVTIGLCGAVMVLLVLSQRFVRNVVDNEVHHNSLTQSVQLDAIVSMANLRIGGYAGTYVEDWRQHLRHALDAMVQRTRIQQGWLGAGIGGVQALAPLAILIISLTWVRTGEITLGEAVAVQGVTAILFGLCSSVFQSYTEATVASRYLERADDIYTYPEERRDGERIPLPHNGIDLEDVEYRFTEQATPTLRAISAHIAPGAVVALVGESGSGKTTLGKLLCSLYSPTSGTIRFGGVPVDDYNLDHLRSAIGYIPQETYLHNRSLAENLTLGTSATQEEAIAFCNELPFLDFIGELPMGYHTVVSEMGANFSGGQRQRIAIAKALLRRPQILILDEATSSLDNANQELVRRCIAELRCTQVIIAHRMSTVVGADQIFVMADGEITEAGNHLELSVRGGHYARLFSDHNVKEMAHG